MHNSQWVQFFSSTIANLFSRSRTLTGHNAMHAPQPKHLSLSITNKWFGTLAIICGRDGYFWVYAFPKESWFNKSGKLFSTGTKMISIFQKIISYSYTPLFPIESIFFHRKRKSMKKQEKEKTSFELCWN